MSATHDKMKQVRLYPEQVEKLEAIGRKMVIDPGLTALVNRAVDLGLPILDGQVLARKPRNRKNHEQKKS